MPQLLSPFTQEIAGCEEVKKQPSLGEDFLGSEAMCLPAPRTRWQREVSWRDLLSSIPMCQPGRLGSSLLSRGQYE